MVYTVKLYDRMVYTVKLYDKKNHETLDRAFIYQKKKNHRKKSQCMGF